jgi:hypothetical protein
MGGVERVRLGAGDGPGHATVYHSTGGWVRDDGEGENEVHNNSLEGLLAGPRNFLWPFRGVNNWYLEMDVGIFQRGHTTKAVTGEFIRALPARPPITGVAP